MELQDEIFSPFPSFTSTQKSYLTMPDADRIVTQTYYNWDDVFFYMEIELGSRIHTEKRVRYSIWNLISDVGSFSDGIYLMCSIFMSAYSAMAFKTTYLNRSYYDAEKDPRED